MKFADNTSHTSVPKSLQKVACVNTSKFKHDIYVLRKE